MNFEDFQKSWQSQNAGNNRTINADLLLKEVRRNQRHFWATICWRDAREVGVAAFLTWLFLHWGVRGGDWTMYLLALSCFGVGAFMLLDRWLLRKRRPASNDPLKACVEASLIQVNHQIWLLKNVLWWYLLPLGIALEISIGLSVWRGFSWSFGAAAVQIIFALLLILLYWGIYWLNQYAVRKSLEPRRQELESLLTTLNQ